MCYQVHKRNLCSKELVSREVVAVATASLNMLNDRLLSNPCVASKRKNQLLRIQSRFIAIPDKIIIVIYRRPVCVLALFMDRGDGRTIY